MSTKEDETEKSNLDVVKSYYKSLTLQKKYGTTGSIEMENGAVYIGDLDENGVRTGMGHLEIPNGSTYDGSFYKGLPNGIGVMRFADSSRYEGELMQGWFHGYGVFSTIDGMKYEGEFREEGCKEAIKRARKVAILARRCSDEFKVTCDINISINGEVGH